MNPWAPSVLHIGWCKGHADRQICDHVINNCIKHTCTNCELKTYRRILWIGRKGPGSKQTLMWGAKPYILVFHAALTNSRTDPSPSHGGITPNWNFGFAVLNRVFQDVLNRGRYPKTGIECHFRYVSVPEAPWGWQMDRYPCLKECLLQTSALNRAVIPK